MKKHSLAALGAGMLIVAASAGTLVAPDMAYAQASSAAVAAPASALPQSATPAAGIAALPPAPVAAAEVTNPYGLDALWKNGDFVARFVLILLAIMSMGSWYIMITKYFEQFHANRRAKIADEQIWRAPSLVVGAGQLEESSPFRFMTEAAIKAGQHHDEALLEAVDRNTWIDAQVDRSITSVSNRLQDGLAFLGTVGSTAPFVGLFGTVWGIYHALTAIGIAGQASIDKVAGPVGEALIMTAIGLAVAVPAVMGYNWLTRSNRVLTAKLDAFAFELLTFLSMGRALQAGRKPGSVPLAAVT